MPAKSQHAKSPRADPGLIFVTGKRFRQSERKRFSLDSQSARCYSNPRVSFGMRLLPRLYCLTAYLLEICSCLYSAGQMYLARVYSCAHIIFISCVL